MLRWELTHFEDDLKNSVQPPHPVTESVQVVTHSMDNFLVIMLMVLIVMIMIHSTASRLPLSLSLSSIVWKYECRFDVWDQNVSLAHLIWKVVTFTAKSLLHLHHLCKQQKFGKDVDQKFKVKYLVCQKYLRTCSSVNLVCFTRSKTSFSRPNFPFVFLAPIDQSDQSQNMFNQIEIVRWLTASHSWKSLSRVASYQVAFLQNDTYVHRDREILPLFPHLQPY